MVWYVPQVLSFEKCFSSPLFVGLICFTHAYQGQYNMCVQMPMVSAVQSTKYIRLQEYS